MIAPIEEIIAQFGLERMPVEMVQHPMPSLNTFPIMPYSGLLIVLPKDVKADGYLEVLYFEPDEHIGFVHSHHKIESVPRKAYKLLIDVQTNEVQIIREFSRWEADYFSRNQMINQIQRKDVYHGRPDIMDQMIEQARQKGQYYQPPKEQSSIVPIGAGLVLGAAIAAYAVSKHKKR